MDPAKYAALKEYRAVSCLLLVQHVARMHGELTGQKIKQHNDVGQSLKTGKSASSLWKSSSPHEA
jgi:hypothetical protein